MPAFVYNIDPYEKITTVLAQSTYLEKEFYALIRADESIVEFTEKAALNGVYYRDLQNPDNDWLNPRLRAVLGYTVDSETIDVLRWQDIVQPDDAYPAMTNLPEPDADIIEIGEEVVRFRHKDGSPVWMRCRGRVIKNGPGTPTRLLIGCTVTTDAVDTGQPDRVVAAKKLEEEHRLLRTIIDNIPINIYVKDTQSRKVLLNRAEYEYMGASSAEEVIGKDDHELYPDESAQLSIAEDRHVTETGQSILGLETLNTRLDGSECWFLTSKIPLYNEHEGVSGLLGISLDITARKQAEIELQRTKELLEETNKVARIGGWELDLIRQKIYWTKTTREIHEMPEGFEPDLHKGIEFYKEGSNRERIAQAVTECIEHGTPWDMEFQIITATGRELWVRAMGKADETNGVRNRLYGTFQDIDELKRSQIRAYKSADLLKKLSDRVPGALYQFQLSADNQPSFSYVSDGITEIFELLPDEITEDAQKLIARLHPDDVVPMFESTIQSKRALHRWEMDFRVILPIKGERWLRAESMPEQLDNECTLWNGYFQDITVRKQSEQELSKSREQAEAASKSKSEFLANMSHEIRTPLNGIIGFTDLLMRTDIDDMQHQYMSMVHQSANSLLDIVNDILDFSKIEAGKLDLSIEQTDVLEIGSQVADMIKYQAHKKDLEMLLNIAPDVPRFAWCDPVRLRQIVVNLLGNAVKFTERGEVELCIEALPDAKPGRTTFRFSVRDTGIGIDTKNQKKIFEAFTQEDTSTTRRFGGTGLGITISNKLLGLMNSQLQVESQPGVGSTFYFDVSFRSAPGESVEWANDEQIRSVLIVDDNASNRMILKNMLALKNIETAQAANGLIALEKLSAGEKYDVILMDYHMPYLDGIQTIRNIRKDAITLGNLPIILLHSSSDDEFVHTACNELAVPVRLIKPVRMQQLFNSFSQMNVSPDHGKSKSPERVGVLAAGVSPEFVKVLIAEDNPINMLLVTTLLRNIVPGVTIITAVNGAQAVEKSAEDGLTMIFMDVQMPELNGYEAALAIRAAEKEMRVPIIALTAGTVKGERERCLESGMDDYVTKPVVKNTLDAVVKKWLAILAHQKEATMAVRA